MKLFVLLIFSVYSFYLDASSEKPILANTFLVLFKNKEAIFTAHTVKIANYQTTYQQVEIYCPEDTAALSRIHSNIATSSRVPLDKRIPLDQIIKPILPIITELIKQDKKNCPFFGFKVTPDKPVEAATFEPSLLQGCRIFKLDNNPIDEKWFS